MSEAIYVVNQEMVDSTLTILNDGAWRNDRQFRLFAAFDARGKNNETESC